MDLRWTDSAWIEYLECQNDKVLLKKINILIKDIQRDPFVRNW